jgi:hypothetical protein
MRDMYLLYLQPVHPYLEGRSHRALWPLVEIVGWTFVVVLIGVIVYDTLQDWVWSRRNSRAGVTAPKNEGDLRIAETSVLRRLFMKRLPPTTKVLTRRGFSPAGGTGADDYSPTGRNPREPRDRPGGVG